MIETLLKKFGIVIVILLILNLVSSVYVAFFLDHHHRALLPSVAYGYDHSANKFYRLATDEHGYVTCHK